jgi:lamin tail-like protein/putative Ig domain-containing protein/HYR domain-containing protein/transmembrane protein TMEM131
VPDGLTLDTAGTLSGTPTAAGLFTFGVLATAANGCTGTASFTVNVVVPIIVTASPASLDFGIVPASTTATLTVTITNATAFPITLTTPFAITGPDPSPFAVGAPGSTTLAGRASTTASVSFSPAAGGVKNATLTIAASGGGAASVALKGTGAVATRLLISELRTRGPAGGNDEFVEIYNNTDGPIAIGGYTLRGSNSVGTNSVRATVPGGVMLPARGHYLFANGGYGGGVLPNVTYGTGITDDGGAALADADGTVVDAVGMSGGSIYKEGTTLAPLTTNTPDRAYERKPGHGAIALQDTDDNATDFAIVSPPNPASLGLTVAPGALDFGTVNLGEPGFRSVAVTNNLVASVALDAPAVSGPDSAMFTADAPATATLPGGATTTILVTFLPTAVGARNASLAVTGTNGASAAVSLAGAGTCPTVTVSGALPTAEFGSAYAQTLTASETTGTFVFEVVAGALPDHMSLDHEGTLTGTPAALGAFDFDVRATSSYGCAGTAGFRLTVVDTTAPVLSLPADITMEATGAATPVSYTATASDLVDGAVAPVCSPASGSVFAVGTTTVQCTATDAHHNTASGSFAVTITDHTPPTLTLPTSLTAVASTPAGATVTYSASASDVVDGPRPVVCAPVSGSTFPIGATTVNCSASDAHGNAANGSFTVTVTTADVPGRMIGNATIDAGSVRQDVDFQVQERATGADAGRLRYQVRTRRSGRDQQDRFESTAITSVSFFDVPGVSPGHKPPSGIDTASFAGVGQWNGRAGYTFDAVATDAGEPGRGRDSFRITVRDGAGQVVASVDGVITDGNIQSLRPPSR